MDILLLRFDAPLMSFGGVMVDQHGPTERFPGLSMLAGLFGNALGYSHGEADKLEALQARIEYAARWDVEPEPLLDYHTVDLGPPKDVKPDQWFKMREPGWTTHGAPEHRGGGDAARYGTHIRYRHYWANGVMTVAVALAGEANPNLQELAEALRQPARPLFLGRKACLPAAPIFLDRAEADDVLEALRNAPLATRLRTKAKRSPLPDIKTPSPSGRGLGEGPRDGPGMRVQACWPARLGEAPDQKSRTLPIYDRRDWRNQIHAGRRLRIEGLLEVLS